MPLAAMTSAERVRALDGIELCAGPEGAAVDLDRSLELRRLLRRPLDWGGWERAWRIAAEVIVAANAGRLLSIMQEPIVLAAQRELQAVAVCGRR